MALGRTGGHAFGAHGASDPRRTGSITYQPTRVPRRDRPQRNSFQKISGVKRSRHPVGVQANRPGRVNKHSSQHTLNSFSIHFLFGRSLVVVLLARGETCEQICCCTRNGRFARPRYPGLRCGSENAHAENGKAAHDARDGRPSPPLSSSPLCTPLAVACRWSAPTLSGQASNR